MKGVLNILAPICLCSKGKFEAMTADQPSSSSRVQAHHTLHGAECKCTPARVPQFIGATQGNAKIQFTAEEFVVKQHGALFPLLLFTWEHERIFSRSSCKHACCTKHAVSMNWITNPAGEERIGDNVVHVFLIN